MEDLSDYEIDDMEEEYAKFLDDYAKNYDYYDGQGSHLTDHDISTIDNNIEPCTDNVYGQSFGRLSISGQLIESYVF
ncbi:unnamed protein product [Trifolium pratense]|uniref:Uncharacterized protein n=1 Tax=Trifolium pratense TaxID=57577 RepID=A0ACB0KPA6_TRIPR|nr:unnamed protein product [Trifolium pratense]